MVFKLDYINRIVLTLWIERRTIIHAILQNQFLLPFIIIIII